MLRKTIGYKVGLLLGLGCMLWLASCRQQPLYGRLVNIPDAAWSYGTKMQFELEVTDTVQSYYLVATIRHTHRYAYRNIWLRLGLWQPGSNEVSYQDFDVPLANNTQWLGVGMDDVYERRVRLFKQPVRFTATGKARFTLEQIMRDDPLLHVLQAGIRLEPAPR